MKNAKLTASSILDDGTIGGFTLLEVLIAFAITCIVLAALYSSFFISHRAVSVVDDSLIRLQECRSVVDVIKREMESSLYDRNKKYTLFKLEDRDFYGKEASQLTFTSFSPLLPGLAKISYVVIESDNKRLVLTKKMVSAYSPPEDTEGMDLMEDIDSFTVEVRYDDKWVKTWDGELTGRIPDEIRISVTIRPKKGENPLTVSDIARPRIGRAL
jgi:general secretion pathway protein J